MPIVTKVKTRTVKSFSNKNIFKKLADLDKEFWWRWRQLNQINNIMFYLPFIFIKIQFYPILTQIRLSTLKHLKNLVQIQIQDLKWRTEYIIIYNNLNEIL